MSDPKDNVHPKDQIVKFDFHGDPIDVIPDGDRLWVSVNAISRNLGLAPNKQIEKLKRQRWATSTMKVSVAEDGKRRALFCLDVRRLPMWLACIQESRVKPDLRDMLAVYQEEAAEALADRFLGKQRSAPTPPPHDHGPPHTGALLRHSRERVYVLNQARATAKAIGANIQRVLGELRREFRVVGYLDIPACSFDRIERLLSRIARGEILLQKRLPVPRPTNPNQPGLPFNPDDSTPH